jgi:hypothetical protein
MLAFAALALVLAACTLSVAPSPTPFILLPTPNLVLTALAMIPGTATAGPASTAVPTAVPTSTVVPVTATSAYCTGTNLANFVSESIPDGTSMALGAAFTKTWTLTNVGTCTWDTGYSLVFVSGSQMSGPSSVPLTADVPPGSSVTLSVNLVAPTVAGTYTAYYELSTDQGIRFGVGAGGANDFWVQIVAGTPQQPYYQGLHGYPQFPTCRVPSPVMRPSANGSVVQAFYTGGSTATYPTPLMSSGDVASDPFFDTPLPYTANHLVFKSSNYGSVPSGYTVSYELKWDATNLYVGAEIVDPNGYVQEATGGNMYKGDSLEILLDTNLAQDYCRRSLSENDFQLGLSGGYNMTAPEAYLWYPKGQAGSKVIVEEIGEIVSVTPVGWDLKAVIPWSVLGISPGGGEYYGFAFSVSANEVSGTAQQQAVWSSDPYRLLTDPMTWGTLEIEIKTGP